MNITTKTDSQRFVTEDLGIQDFPNSTNKVCVVVDKTLDLSGKKWTPAGLVDKTETDLAAELSAETLKLDTEYKKLRELALLSFELTIFSDSTLSEAKRADILRVRQEWRDITRQEGYPSTFVAPSLTPELWT